jgi:UDP-N-acetylglucosamine acyltransferase
MIHPTALVDARAELGTRVSVGPGSVIGPEVRIEEGTEIGAHVILEGAVRIGARCRIGHGAIVGAPPQDLKYRPGTPSGVAIGDDTVLREYVTVHRATREGGETRVGRHCLLMTASHVAHDCEVGDHVILINNAGLTGHVIVEERVTVGGLSGVHPFARIGAYAYIGGCSKVSQDVPPFVIVDGNPATARAVNVIGMRRAGLPTAQRRGAQEAFRVLYRSGLAPAAAARRLREELADDPMAQRIVNFLEQSRLGIVRWHRGAAAPAEEPVV